MTRGEDLLARWLEDGGPPPSGLEASVVEAVAVFRPELAPAPRIDLDEIFDRALARHSLRDTGHAATVVPLRPRSRLLPLVMAGIGTALAAVFVGVILGAVFRSEAPAPTVAMTAPEERVSPESTGGGSTDGHSIAASPETSRDGAGLAPPSEAQRTRAPKRHSAKLGATSEVASPRLTIGGTPLLVEALGPHRADLEACASEAGRRGPASGRMVFGPGTDHNAAIVEDTVGDPLLTECIERVLVAPGTNFRWRPGTTLSVDFSR